jgi:hypothetical protein
MYSRHCRYVTEPYIWECLPFVVPGLTSTVRVHVAQGAGMSPIIMLDELVTPTAVFVGVTRSRRRSPTNSTSASSAAASY